MSTIVDKNYKVMAIIIKETFEGDKLLPGFRKQFVGTHSFNVSSDYVFEGVKSARFELRENDKETSGGTRAEFLGPELTDNNIWIKFALYFPEDNYKKDSSADILMQLHQGSSPATSLRIEDDNIHIRVGNVKENRKKYNIAAQTKNVWHEIIMHFVLSDDDNVGLTEVWHAIDKHEPKKVISLRAGNIYKGNDKPRLKFGIYKDDWNSTRKTDSTIRVFYLADFRMGDAKTSLNELTVFNSAKIEPAPAPIPLNAEIRAKKENQIILLRQLIRQIEDELELLSRLK